MYVCKGGIPPPPTQAVAWSGTPRGEVGTRPRYRGGLRLRSIRPALGLASVALLAPRSPELTRRSTFFQKVIAT